MPRYGGECEGVYFHRLLRDGWTMRPELALGTRLARATVFDQPLRHAWTLRKLAHATIGAPPGKGVYYDEHELVGPDGRELPRHDWEWADVDGDRVVWATGGRLFAGHMTRSSAKADDPIVEPHVLHDFNGMTFQAIAAPYDREAMAREKAARRAARRRR